MPSYGNRSGDSGVLRYRYGPTWIEVQFVDGAWYRYTDESAGAAQVAAMKRLAEAGAGLSTYISQHVRTAYESKSGPSRRSRRG